MSKTKTTTNSFINSIKLFKIMTKKLLTFLTLLTLFFGVGWAEETVYYTLDGTTTGGSNGYATESDITQNGMSWKVYGNTTLSPWRIGGKNLGTNKKRPIYSYTAMGSAISKVTVDVGTISNSNLTVQSINLTVASDTSFTTQLDYVSKSVTANSTIEFTPTSGTEWSSGKYYRIQFILKNNTNSNYYVEFKNAKFYKNESSTTTTHNIAYATVTGGSFDGPASAAEGATVSITATPDDAYTFTSWNVTDEDGAITVTDNQFTMGTSDVTVSGTFTLKPTYSITVNNGTASPTPAYEGQTVTLAPTIPDGKVVDWDNTTVSPSSVTINHSDYTFTMPGEAVTVVFAFKDAPTEATYIFNTSEGLQALGITAPTTGNGIDIAGNTYTVTPVSFTSTNGTSTNTRVYNSQGTLSMRVYAGGTFTLSVPTGYNITGINFTSESGNFANSTNLSASTGSMGTNTWSGSTQTVTFTANAQVRIYTITVYYTASETPVAQDLYIIGNVNGIDVNNWHANQGVKMTHSNGVYTADIWVTGKWNDDMQKNAGTFAFFTVLAENNDDGSWSYVNGNRYEPDVRNINNPDEQIGDGHWWLANDANSVNTNVTLLKRNWNDDFLIPAGLYTVTVSEDLTKFNLTVIKDITPAITPDAGEVTAGTTATIALSEDFNAFIANCPKVLECSAGSESSNYTQLDLTLPEVKLYVNDQAIEGTSSEYTFSADQSPVTITGKGVLLLDDSEITSATKTVSKDYTVVQKYTATIASGITGGTVAFNAAGTNTSLNDLTEGYEVRVYVTPYNNYELTTLTYTIEGSSVAVPITNNAGDYYTFNMPAGNVTINATFTYNGPVVATNTYVKITDLNDLEINRKYLIVCEAGNYAYAGIAKAGEGIEISNGTTEIGTDSGVNQMTLLAGSASGTYIFSFPYNESTYYLTHSGTGQNSVYSTSSASAATEWGIDFDSNGNATITDGSQYLRAYSAGTDFRVYNGTSNQTIQLYKEVGVNVPTFSIPAGTFLNSEYPDGINVALSCSTDGATIYYSTDGENFIQYSTPIPVTSTTTIYAYATKDGKQSNTVSATYKFVDFLVNDVVFSPASGEYYHDQTCQMFTTTKGARIYYTTDGSDPVMNQGTTQLYTGEIEMTQGNTYNFRAVAYLGTTASEVSNANYEIKTGDYPGEYRYLYNIAELNAHETSSSFWTMVNPVQVIFMSKYQNGTLPEFCLVRDNTGYGMIYFGKGNTYHSGYTIFKMGDWIPGGYYGPISWAYSQNDGYLDTHPELGDSYTTSQRVRDWPSSAISNSIVLPEYLTIPEILASGTAGNTDYWGHYVHLRKTTVELKQSTDPGTYTDGRDKYGKWGGVITDENGNKINYYDKFYLQYGGEFDNWTLTDNMFTGHPNRTFDIYGFVACHLPSEIDYQISPFAFAWIDKPVIDKETATYYEPQTVTISSPEDPTATLWYKTDEMDDFAKYIPGTTVITVNSTTTIETYATKMSQYNDELESLHNTITLTFQEIPVPVISPESQVLPIGDEYYVDATIAFESGANVPQGTVILYTINGEDPKTSEEVFTYVVGETTLHFTTTTTVRAIAKVGEIYSAEAEPRTYTFVKSNGIEYTLITDEAQLNENSVYIIVNKANNMAMGNTQDANHRDAVGVAFKEGTNKAIVYGNDDVAQFTLHSVLASDHIWAFQTNNSNVNGYLYVGADEDNTLLTEGEQDTHGNAAAQVLIDETGTDHAATIKFTYEGATDRYVRYYNRNQLFNTYRTITTSTEDVYIYGVEATPLATIEKQGTALPTTNTAENQYTIADELIIVHALGNLLWVKDQGNVSISKTEPSEDQIDYMQEVAPSGVYEGATVLNQGDRPWDQSNWIILEFDGVQDMSEYTSTPKAIKPATLTGHYVDGENYRMIIPAETTLQTTDCDESYMPNVYSPANFLDANLEGDGPQGAQTEEHYFFMNPKIQEVAIITYAVWDGANFVVPKSQGIFNQGDFDGAFSVAWDYNALGQVDLTEDEAYQFRAVLNKKASGNTTSGAKVTPKPGMTPDDTKVVYPLNLSPSGSIVTAVTDVTGKAVAGVKYYNLAGIESDRPFEGVNIVVTTYTDGSRSSSKVLK